MAGRASRQCGFLAVCGSRWFQGYFDGLGFWGQPHRKRRSVVTYGIAAACVAVTVAEIALPEATIAIDRLFAFVPIEFSLHPAVSLYTLVTAEFLHSGMLHLVGNLVFLIAFGRSLRTSLARNTSSSVCRSWRSLIPRSWLLNPASPIPIIGASGALSFLMAAYTVIFPRAKLRIIPFLRVPYVRAWFFPQHGSLSRYWMEFSSAKQLGGVAYNPFWRLHHRSCSGNCLERICA